MFMVSELHISHLRGDVEMASFVERCSVDEARHAPVTYVDKKKSNLTYIDVKERRVISSY